MSQPPDKNKIKQKIYIRCVLTSKFYMKYHYAGSVNFARLDWRIVHVVDTRQYIRMEEARARAKPHAREY